MYEELQEIVDYNSGIDSLLFSDTGEYFFHSRLDAPLALFEERHDLAGNNVGLRSERQICQRVHRDLAPVFVWVCEEGQELVHNNVGSRT
ncbi:hypothetical protein GCM10007890_10360 [Methylobacterium tardum]|uniref:Uncharacterized protein n=1 Tax=Methylobacterium tardum TaxID=374432 RepID=A0AA37WQ86_9HYPH|nr:hypothetical protein GCM10007890_10360 [Methylobacterium tardum]